MNRDDWRRMSLGIKKTLFNRPLMWCGVSIFLLGAGVSPSTYASEPSVLPTSQILTNVNQFWTLTSQDYLRGQPFHLTGIVTLLDTNRNLLVLQDATGALAINMVLKNISVELGQRVSLESSEASPYVESFPDYPYRPSGWNIQTSFEAPPNWGNYHLTRMRGYVHPPATGNYTFWIASDNSSELWLSSDEDPTKVRKIAFISEGDWVNQRDWSRYPSQRSETIFLDTNRTYYIEAFQEQITEDDNLSVAWQGPGLGQAVISGRYLTPWVENPDQVSFAKTDGILREYWTNYTTGNLVGISGPRPYASALSTKTIHLTNLGPGDMPEPHRIFLDQPLPPEDNYRWVEAHGTVSFIADDKNSAILELIDGQGRTQLQVSNWKENWLGHIQNWRVEVNGVCEGTRNINSPLLPGLIWVPTEKNISPMGPVITNSNSFTNSLSPLFTSANANTGLKGFYGTRGVVTFNDQVLNKNCLFIQDDNGGGIFVSQPDPHMYAQLKTGQWIQIGGSLLLDKYAPGLQPLTLKVLGWHAMPEPIIAPTDASMAKNENGQWAEAEGVVRSVGPNGIMTVVGKKGLTSVWIGQTPTNILNNYIDSTLRVRGVISSAIFDRSVLLVPSRNFVEVEEKPPEDPFRIRLWPIANLNSIDGSVQWMHRVKIEGIVTYKDQWGLFIQDGSGGARVQTSGNSPVQIGELTGVAGFPEGNNLLTEALVHPTGVIRSLTPQDSDPAEVVTAKLGGTLVRLKATLLTIKTQGDDQILELEEGQRTFEARLAVNRGKLPPLIMGSRLEITGVCDLEPVDSSAFGSVSGENSSPGSLQIWLRSPADVVLLSGPPWWTWKRVAALIGILFTVLLGTLLWIHLLRRRLERQQNAQLTFSRHVLQGQESERRRIAVNLHDSLGQNLLVIKNQARLAMQPVTDELVWRQRLNEISGMASQAIEEVRQITHGLRPYQLDRLGLTQTIRAAIRLISENSPILFASDVEDIDGLLDKESEIHVYRIVQESINNVVKHSEATEAIIVVKKQAATISLSVRDNGRGFDAGIMNLANLPGVGFGLNGINERTRILGGKLVVESQRGKGVNLTIEIPVSIPKHET
jgi:signal transduction histidine kinase